MSDLLEEAAELSEMLLQKSLSIRHPVPTKTGYCLYCDEHTPGVFCSNDCRDGWELQEKIKKMCGR